MKNVFVFIGEDNLDVAVHFLVAVEDSIEEIGRNRLSATSVTSNLPDCKICECGWLKAFQIIKSITLLPLKLLK